DHDDIRILVDDRNDDRRVGGRSDGAVVVLEFDANGLGFRQAVGGSGDGPLVDGHPAREDRLHGGGPADPGDHGDDPVDPLTVEGRGNRLVEDGHAEVVRNPTITSSTAPTVTPTSATLKVGH